MQFAVAAAAGEVPLASLSDCGPRTQLRTILFWVELLRLILLFMFIRGHLFSLGPLTRFGSKVFSYWHTYNRMSD